MAIIISRYRNGVLVGVYNDDTREYTEYAEDGSVIEVRPYTDDENVGADTRAILDSERIIEDSIRAKAELALTVNRDWLNRSTTPTNAQTLTHIDRLTREVNGLIRLVLRRLDSQEGT